MRIETIPVNEKANGGKRDLGAAEKWLFDTEDGEIRLVSLLKMEDGKRGVAELSEFKGYGSDAETTNGLAISLNRVFLLGKLALKACGRKEGVVIVKLARFKADAFGKAESREMGANHAAVVMEKLKEVKEVMKSEKSEKEKAE